MRLIRRVFVLVALLLIAQTSTPAWHDTGHMLVAQVAYLRLTPSAHGGDVVTVILADFRGLDTMVEITVLAVAIVGVVSLLRQRTAR